MLRAVVWPYYDVKTVEFVWLRLTITYLYDVDITSGPVLNSSSRSRDLFHHRVAFDERYVWD
jgi:hypothetical protein